jgi:NAD(P)H-hydrate repair Nnr-like enzyme with NAD(P)H-hydrate dehydratase domain
VVVHVLLADPARVHPGGLSALRDAGGRVASDTSVLSRADLVIDGLLGIGGRGGLRGTYAELASAAQDSGAPILAVDLPSGIDADTGVVTGDAVRADVTVTFGTHKPGLFVDPGASHAGVVEFIDIGLEFPPSVEPVLENLQEDDVRELLPSPSHSSHKYSRGVVGLAVGSNRYPGAAMLAVGAALRSGVGAVRYSGPVDVVGRYPEVLMGSGRVQAWVVGSGLGQDDEAARRLSEVLATDLPVVVDADGLRLLPRKKIERSAPTILTPHAGEAAALLDVTVEQIEGQRLESVRRLADSYDATVCLKGPFTLIAGPLTSRVRVNTHASAVLATAGSGDVLAGLVGGLLAGGLTPDDAVSVGAYLHGATGLLAARSGPVAAGDLVASLPLAWHNIQE